MAPVSTFNQTDNPLNGEHISNGAKPKAHAELEKLQTNKIDRFWRGDKDGKIDFKTTHGIPHFEDKYKERDWIKAHLAAAFRYWGKLGYGEGLAGHITVRDPVLTDHYWMNSLGVHYSCISVSFGNTIDECIFLFALLDRHCKLQLMAEAAAANGISKITIDKEDAEYNAKSLQDPEKLYANFQPEYNLLIQETKGAFLQ
ncbi:hypothetical protein L218DRAFT_941732 [Marasmius fiardii PR-910]|nr:hypothetical protein L218DRAFT_941732 [Marasmius fiardii PR-910]